MLAVYLLFGDSFFFAKFICLLYIFFSKFFDVVLVRVTIAMVTDHNQNEHGEKRVYWTYISWTAVRLRKQRQEFQIRQESDEGRSEAEAQEGVLFTDY